jgi:hypothetical protein
MLELHAAADSDEPIPELPAQIHADFSHVHTLFLLTSLANLSLKPLHRALISG